MNILRVITRMNGGGPARQVAYLHRAFEEAGHYSKLIYGQLDESEVDFSHLIHDHDRVKVSGFLKRPISVFSDILACCEILFELLLHPYDVIHTHTAKAGLCGRVAAIFYKPIACFLGRPKLKVTHTFHGHVFSGYFDREMENKVKKIEAWLWGHSDLLIALTEKLKTEIVEHLNVDASKIKVVQLGLDLEPLLEIERSDVYNSELDAQYKTWVGWVGRMVPIKNPMYFIRMVSELENSHPDIGFVMIGDGLLRDSLELEVKKLGLEKRVFFLGWKNDLRHVYAGMDVMMNTSDNEGTPVAVIEALASGISVYAIDVGGVKEVLQCSIKNKVLNSEITTALSEIKEGLSRPIRLNQHERQNVVDQYSQNKLYEKLVLLYRVTT